MVTFNLIFLPQLLSLRKPSSFREEYDNIDVKRTICIPILLYAGFIRGSWSIQRLHAMHVRLLQT